MSCKSNRISELRIENNLTQKELAQKIGINHTVLSRMETGERPIKDDELRKIADYFNVSLDYLLGRPDTHKNNNKSKAEELEEDFPEGISILYRANQNLTPEQKEVMLRMIKATFLEDENKK